MGSKSNLNLVRGTLNFLLTEGQFSKLDLGLSEIEEKEIVNYMGNKLRIFYDRAEKGESVLEAAEGNSLYGGAWDMYNPTKFYKEFQLPKLILTDHERETMQLYSRGLVHFIFRNGVVEDIHARKGNKLTDTNMKKLNKDLMNRAGFLLENLTLDRGHSEEVWKQLLERVYY